MIETTEKKHWLNGHDVRGGWFHSWAWTDDEYGVLFFWGWKNLLKLPVLKFKIYKLI